MRYVAIFTLSLLFAGTAAAAAAPLDWVIDGAAPGREFGGIGATSGGGATSRLLIDYPEPQRSQILDYLFKPHYGASLQQLKVEIGSDANSTEGAEPTHARTPQERNFTRGYEWWLIKEARRRNPHITLAALAWNFPAWVGKSNSQATADYLVSFLEGAHQQHGIDFDYIGIWNETKMDRGFIKTLRATLNAHGLKTRIMADDSVNSWDLVPAMEADAALRASIDVIATHYPRWLSTPLARAKSEQWGVPLWSSEDGPWGDEWGIAGQQSPPLAQLLNRNYILGRMTSTNIWNLVTTYNDAFELPNAGLMRAKSPWSGHYQVLSPIWVVAHTTQFAQPGWRYIDSASALIPAVGSAVTLHDGEHYSLVLETLDATQPHAMRFHLRGGLFEGPVYVWRSDATHALEKVARLQPSAGKFEFSFQPNSVYTLTNTTGQSKGTATPPAERPFPMPYRDDFESGPGGSLAPRYLFEANGAFEVGACTGNRRGRCLWQVSQQPPLGWTYYGEWPRVGTLATLGDKRWQDYQIAADVLVPSAGYAAVYGRVSRVTSDGSVDAYQFRLYDDGRWELRAAASGKAISAGHTSPALNRWRHVQMVFQGPRISALVDYAQVLSIDDASHAAGLGGVGSGWNRAAFDRLEITPIAPTVPVMQREQPAAAPATIPSSPELYVPVAGDHLVRLAWKAVPGASTYRVRIGTREDLFDKTEEAGNVVNYTFRTLTNGVKYYFNVSAVNATGEGKPSGIQYAVPQASGTEP